MNSEVLGIKPTVAVSACLMGEKVRYDGGHKRSVYLQQNLAGVFNLQSICPEVAIGLGIPRQPIRLVQTERGVRALGSKDASLDATQSLDSYADQMLPELQHTDGYIFMQKSPSCGAFRVKVYSEDGNQIVASQAGIYAQKIQRILPNLPVEEAGRLSDPVLLENFMTRVFCRMEWRTKVLAKPTVNDLVCYHARHKALLKAHSPDNAAKLGRIVAVATLKTLPVVLEEYEACFMSALMHKAKRKNHAHVLMDLAKSVSRQMSPNEKAEWETLVARYRAGEVPLIVPLTLLRHYSLSLEDGFIRTQSYLEPHPYHLGLRNQI